MFPFAEGAKEQTPPIEEFFQTGLLSYVLKFFEPELRYNLEECFLQASMYSLAEQDHVECVPRKPDTARDNSSDDELSDILPADPEGQTDAHRGGGKRHLVVIEHDRQL